VVLPAIPGIQCELVEEAGGEDEALATGMSPVGLGNDIGSSLGNLAFCSGIAAIKATTDRIKWVSMLTLAKTLDSFLHRLVCARAVFAFKNQSFAQRQVQAFVH